MSEINYDNIISQLKSELKAECAIANINIVATPNKVNKCKRPNCKFIGPFFFIFPSHFQHIPLHDLRML